MTFQEIKDIIVEEFGADAIESSHAEGLQPFVYLPLPKLHSVVEFLYKDSRFYFDYLACITGIDNGPEKNTMELDYRLYSIPYDHSFVLKVKFARTPAEGNTDGFKFIDNAWMPIIPTVSDIWRTANWHERETFDLMGIYFENHPDLRRILLPADWQGHPLRKDYVEQEFYQDIKVKY